MLTGVCWPCVVYAWSAACVNDRPCLNFLYFMQWHVYVHGYASPLLFPLFLLYMIAGEVDITCLHQYVCGKNVTSMLVLCVVGSKRGLVYCIGASALPCTCSSVDVVQYDPMFQCTVSRGIPCQHVTVPCLELFIMRQLCPMPRCCNVCRRSAGTFCWNLCNMVITCLSL